MRNKDKLLAFMVVILWGFNFTAIKLGLEGVPSTLLAALRYTCLLPVVFFVKKPTIPLGYGVAYGLCVGVGQFGSLFYAMEIGMPAGLSSIVLQASAFITPLLAFFFLQEPMNRRQHLGLIIAACGLLFIANSGQHNHIAGIPISGLLLTLLAASFWALSNIILRYAANQAIARGETIDMFGLVIWASLIPPIPLFLIAFWIDSPATILSALTQLSSISIFSILYLAFGATLLGYGGWSYLLGRYPASRIAPFSLLVPVTGLLSAKLVLGEQMTSMQWIGGITILAGLIIANFDLSRFQQTT
ncbi:EamA family transporter [Tindallia californiensis]|uniref:O-acetylserine/cysteine efflux transporter n=1 Tax=Tindallia californiensis TaxID=159292 RepID=A0A1H3R5H3_9FIRM|nr:EamA family transporter [Tindallia californiensis]SDZ20773.1 O-acetylserine/cysteine efflux transporter [Tindallia californiensis]